jgi:hypothetical protein
MDELPAREVVEKMDVTVVIPAHPARLHNGMLDRALASVYKQTLLPQAISVAIDTAGEGAAVNRQRALDGVKTNWIAFLDSDDELLPNHLQALTDVAKALDAVFVYSWFEPVGMADPLGHFGIPFDPLTPHHTTMTVLVRTDVAKEVGFTAAAAGSPFGNEDWLFILGVCEIAVDRGLKMIHLAERTWRYHGHGLNTCGMPHKGDAAKPWQ